MLGVSRLRIRAFAGNPFGLFLATHFYPAKNRSLSLGTLVRGAPSSKTTKGTGILMLAGYSLSIKADSKRITKK